MFKKIQKTWHRIAIMPKPPFISAIIRALVKLFVPNRFEVEGIHYVLNPADYIIKGTLFLGLYEKAEREVFSNLIHSGDRVVDIGANIGIFTGIAAKRVGDTGEVIAFEPEPNNASYLTEMLQLNQFTQVTLESKGVADRATTFRLYLSKDNMGDHRLEPSEEARESIEIQAVTLDDYLAGKTPKIIKMDIQGSEGLALRGMLRTLQAMAEGAVIMEFWPYAIRRSGVEPNEVLQRFTDNGFAGYEVDTINSGLKPIDPLALLKLKTVDDAVNILFLKGAAYTAASLRSLGYTPQTSP